MKPHPTLTIVDILAAIHGESLPERSDGTPMTTEQRVAVKARMAAMTVHTACIACDASVPIDQSSPCECGGFVCDQCRAIEGDESCDHEKPVL